MDKVKKFIDCYVPVYKCNLKCQYCYISTWEDWKQSDNSRKIEYSPETIRKALSKERWEGCLLLNFCAAGETLLCDELLSIIEELLKEGHYCMIVTNGTITPKFKKIAKLSNNLKKHLFIKFSYHYLELKRLNLLNTFFNNVKMMKENNISFTVEVTPSDDYIPYIEEMKQECLKNVGAIPHVTVCRTENGEVPIMTKLEKEDYINVWKKFESELFEFKIRIFGKKRKEFCYAGAWSYTLNLLNGDLMQCYRGRKVQNIYKNIKAKIKEIPIGCNCIDAHCWNGHAFLAFGDIPELETPTFEEERNRKTVDGSWITKEMSEFMSSKLYDTNKKFNKIDKIRFNILSKFYSSKYFTKRKIKSIIYKLKGGKK